MTDRRQTPKQGENALLLTPSIRLCRLGSAAPPNHDPGGALGAGCCRKRMTSRMALAVPSSRV